jgi:LacI family transcriptional regulator
MIFIHRRLFDDMQTASYMAPTLTTIRQPAYEMGQRAAKLLLQMIEKKLKPVQDMMDSTLIVRESTTKVPGTSDSSN